MELVVYNIEGELDCMIFECLVILFEYMLCNVIDYGIEDME